MVESTNHLEHLISDDIIRIKNEYYQLSHEDTKELRLQLLDMGFNLSIINMVFCFYTINNIDDAITYMTKTNDVWQHHYTNVDDKCIICGENSPHLDQHEPDMEMDEEDYRKINRFRISSSFLSEEYGNNHLEEEKEENELCSVCYNNEIEKNMQLSIKCKHEFCLDCWKRYVSESIQRGKVLHIICMNVKCTQELTEKDVLLLFGGQGSKEDNETYEKYQKFLKRRLNEASGNQKQCPIRDCEGYGSKDKEGNKYIKCENGHKFCYECLKPWHGSASCEEIIDKDFFKWKKRKVIKKCPNCFFWTEKNEGCNHMTCPSCHFQWCWICTKKYTNDHYQFGGCSGLQFSNVIVWNEGCCSCCNNLMFRLLFYFIILGIILLAMIIGAPFLAGVFIYVRYIEMHDFDFGFSLTKISITATGVIVSIIFQPFITSLSVVSFLLLLIASLFYPPLMLYFGDAFRESL